MSRVDVPHRSRSGPRRLWVARSTRNVNSCTRSVLLAVTLVAAAAAQRSAPLEVDFEVEPVAGPLTDLDAPAPDCGAFLRAATTRLRAAGDSGELQATSGATGLLSSGPLLAFLWVADDARAGALLAREAAGVGSGGDDAAPAWLLIHHYWFLRATGDAATVRGRLPALLAAAAGLAAGAHA